MTTVTWSTVYAHDSTAHFRTWGLELSTKLAAGGLTKTSDTGQINWASVNRPGTGVVAGYEIWRFADSTIYFKLEYGTGSAGVNNPELLLTVGTGSNGSGTITGQSTTVSVAITSGSSYGSSGPTSLVTGYPSYLCVTADYVGLCHKAGGNVYGCNALFAIRKWTDATGAAVSTGFSVLTSDSANTGTSVLWAEHVRTAATAQTFTRSQTFCLVPSNVVTSDTGGGANQVFLHFQNSPAIIPDNFVCTICSSELPLATTFSTSLVGATAHTMISLGINSGGSGNSGSSGTNWGIAMRWE